MSECLTKDGFIEQIKKKANRELSSGEIRYYKRLYDKLKQAKMYDQEEKQAEEKNIDLLEQDNYKINTDNVKPDEPVVSKLSTEDIDLINANKPLYKNRFIQVLNGKTVDNKVILTIKDKDKVIHNIDADVVKTNNMDIRSTILFSSSSDKTTDNTGERILKATKTTSKEELLNIFDTLAKIDNIDQDDKHNKTLRKTLSKIAKPAVNAAKEISIYLDKKAKKNNGYIEFKGNTAEIYLARGVDKQSYGNEMPLTEKYAHEMVHAVTHWAFNSTSQAAAKAKMRLINLHRTAMQHITPEMLMPEVSINEEVEKQIAEATYDYINKNIEEFLAYAVTNKKVMETLNTIKVKPDKESPEKFVDKLVYWIRKLIDTAINLWKPGEKNMKADALAFQLMKDLMKISEEINNATAKEGIRDKISDVIDKAEEFVSNKIDEFLDKQEQKAIEPMPIGKGKTAEAIWTARNIVQLLVNPKLKGEFKTILNEFGLAPEGTVQTIIQKLKNNDEYEDVAEDIGLASLEVDRNRETTSTSIDNLVTQSFKKLNKKTSKLLYNVLLKYDVKLLVDKYEKDAINFFKSDKTLNDRIDKLTEELNSKTTAEEMRYYEYQIDGLVRYIKTGEGSLIQLKNAEAIAKMAGTPKAKHEVDSEIIDAIDELVSLKLIKDLEPKTKEKMIEVLKSDFEGVLTASRMQRGFERYLTDRETDTERLNRPKGYVRETYDPYTVTTTAPLSKKRSMEKEGYKLIAKLPVGTVGDKTPMGLYVSSTMERLPFNRSAIRYTGEHQQGLSFFEHRIKISDPFASENSRKDKEEADLEAEKLFNQVISGKKVDEKLGIMPELDTVFSTNTYRYNIKEEHKLKYMKISQSVGEAIGRSWAHQVDIEESKAVNEVAWEEMMVDMGKNYRGTHLSVNGFPYVLIDANSPNSQIRDIARILPKEFKEKLRLIKKAAKKKHITDNDAKAIVGKEAWDRLAVYQREHLKRAFLKGQFAVRRDMLTKLFGFRDLSITDLSIIKKLPGTIKRLIKVIENAWKELIKLYSVDVVIKTIMVPIENFISNFWYVVVDGYSPIEVLKAQLDGWKYLNKYIKDDLRQKELIGLIHAYPNELKYKREFDRLQAEMKENPVAPLHQLYQHITEDLGTGEYNSNSRFSNFINNKIDGAPEIIKTGINYLFLTDRTKLFKMLQKFVMFGDFIARYSQYTLTVNKQIKKRQKEGKPFTEKELNKFKTALIKEITKNFVNYADPDSPLWQYFQDIGLVKFTKYAIGIQKVIRDQAKNHSIRFVGAIALQDALEAATGYNPDTIDEKSILAGHGLFTPGFTGILKQLWDNKFPILNQLPIDLK